jgi:YAP binding domain
VLQNSSICSLESSVNMTIDCSTKVCSFGRPVVEKIEASIADKAVATISEMSRVDER